MDTAEHITTILINMQKKYNFLNELLNLTKEMERVIYSQDNVSLTMLVDMRQNIMNMIDDLDKKNKSIVLNLPEDCKDRIYRISLSNSDTEEFKNPIEENILETKKRIKALLENIVRIDKVLNKKMNLEGSF